MMDTLTQIATNLAPRLAEFLAAALPEDSVRGALLDVDDFWLHLEKLRHLDKPPCFSTSWGLDLDYIWQHRKLAYKIDIEPGFLPPEWYEHCKMMGYPQGSLPIIIRVVLRSPEYLRDLNLRSSIDGYPIVFEHRPPSRALSDLDEFISSLSRALGWSRRDPRPGSPTSVGCDVPHRTSGTPGGLLYCSSTSSHYIVSCAHVLGSPGNRVYSPGPFEGRSSNDIGQVRMSAIPALKAPGLNCSFESSPSASAIDVSIAELWGGVFDSGILRSVSRANHFRSKAQISKNDRVSFNGKESGLVYGRIGALTIWDEIEFNNGAVAGGTRCFGGLFEVKPVAHQYVREDLARAGDSGAWVMSEYGDTSCWDGMVISSDGPQVYACFAENVMAGTHLNGAFPGPLTFLP